MQLLTALNALAVDVLAAPAPDSVAPPGSDRFLMIGGWVKWGAGLACVIGLLAVAATMAIQHRRGTTGEHGAALGAVAVGSVIAGVASGLVTALGA